MDCHRKMSYQPILPRTKGAGFGLDFISLVWDGTRTVTSPSLAQTMARPKGGFSRSIVTTVDAYGFQEGRVGSGESTNHKRHIPGSLPTPLPKVYQAIRSI